MLTDGNMHSFSSADYLEICLEFVLHLDGNLTGVSMQQQNPEPEAAKWNSALKNLLFTIVTF